MELNLNIKARTKQQIIHTRCYRCDRDAKGGGGGLQEEGMLVGKI